MPDARTGAPVRLLLAEDSPLYVALLEEIFLADPRVRVVGIAADGVEAVAMAERLQPDVIVMDVRMPRMDGLMAIEKIMRERPTPILVVTADPAGRSGELAFEALRRGALDFLPKPDDWESTAERRRLCDSVVLLSSVPVVPHFSRRKRTARPPSLGPTARPGARAVGVVASTGGAAALSTLLSHLPDDYPYCVLVVQHLSPGFAPHFASWLNQIALPAVRVAKDGEPLASGTVLVAPDGVMMRVRQGRVRLEPEPDPSAHSGDALLTSLARDAPDSIGVVLTGMGRDGAEGLLALRRAGGVTYAQDRESSVVFGMPQAAAEVGGASEVLSLDAMGPRLVALATRARRRS